MSPIPAIAIRRATYSLPLALGLAAVIAGTALATGASGFHGTPLARGTTAGSMQFNVGDVKFQTKGSVEEIGRASCRERV